MSRPSSRIRAWSSSSGMRISPTPASSSVADTGRPHPLHLDDARDGDDLAAAHDERPAFAVGTRDLGVDEHVLDLLLAAREPVAGPPPPYPKPWQLGFDTPAAPRHGAVDVDGAVLQPEAVVPAGR